MKNLILLLFFIANLIFLQGQNCNLVEGWTIEKQQPTNLQKQHSIFFVDDELGYTVGVGGTMKKTEDGGQNWEILHEFEESGTRAILKSIYFINRDIGFVAGEGEDYFFDDIFTDAVFMKTTDGGISWEKTIVDSINRIHDIRFYDENKGLGLFWSNDREDLIASTTDGGKTWEIVDTALEDFEIREFIKAGTKDFIFGTNSDDEAILIEISETGEIVETHSFPSPYIGHFYFYNELIGYAGSKWKTVDGGKTWFEFEIPIYYYNSLINFADEQHGILINGIYTVDSSSFETIYFLSGIEILTTIDSGLTWGRVQHNLDCAVEGISQSPRNGIIYFYGSYFEGKIEFTGTTVNNNTKLETIQLYPNPTQGTIHFEGVFPLDAQIEIFSSLGQPMLQSDPVDHINIENFVNGIYFVKIFSTKTKQSSLFRMIKN